MPLPLAHAERMRGPSKSGLVEASSTLELRGLWFRLRVRIRGLRKWVETRVLDTLTGGWLSQI